MAEPNYGSVGIVELLFFAFVEGMDEKFGFEIESDEGSTQM